MPLPIIAALALPFIAGGMMGRANAMQEQAKDAQKAQDAESKQLMALGQSLSEGKGGDADVQALKALSHRFAAIPNGQQFFDSFMTRAQGMSLQKSAQQAMMAQMFGLDGGAGPAQAPQAAPQPSLAQRWAQQTGTQGDGTSVTPQGMIQAGLPPGMAPQQPFTGQVGATPVPGPSVQTTRPGIPAARPASQAGTPGIPGLDMANAQPADMTSALPASDRVGGPAPPDAFEASIAALERPTAVPAPAPQTFEQQIEAVSQPQTAKAQPGRVAQTPQAQGPVTLPPFLKTGLGSFTIPKETSGMGVELRGTADELKHHFAAKMRQQGMSPTQVYNEFQQQGVAAPESLQKEAFHDFTKKFFTSPEMLQQPRRALEAIAEHFPGASPDAMRTFGQDVFQAAFVGAQQRLRAAGVHLTEGAIARAAFNETVNAVGSQFIPQSVLQMVERSRATSTDQLMVDVLEKAVEGDAGAAQLYGTLLRMKAGQGGVEEAAKVQARIKAEQKHQFMSTDDLSKIERGGQPLPFGTTPEQAAGRGPAGAGRGPATIVTPEQQATRTQRAKDTDALKFATERSLPLFNAVHDRVQEIMTLTSKAGVLGKVGALAGTPTELGQAVKRFDEFKAAFAGNLRALSGETSGVITEGDVKRIVDILPAGKDFVNLTFDRSKQLVRSFSEIQSLLSDRLGQRVSVFDPIIEQLQKKPTPEQSQSLLDDFDKAMKGVGQ